MNRIEIRGVIVGSEWDSPRTERYIKNGVITPESVFRRALDAATEDVELYVNSPGGSVFSGYEMADAVKAWRDRTGITCLPAASRTFASLEKMTQFRSRVK